MKISITLVLFFLVGSAGLLWGAQTTTGEQQVGKTIPPVSTPYAVVARDANSQTWQRLVYQTSPSGGVTTNMVSYTELSIGLNHLVNGQWVESSEQIDILPNGTAAATNGQHQAYFPGDIYEGAIKLVTSEGLQLVSQPMALTYSDGTNMVTIASLTNSTGVVVGDNQVIYPNAFMGIKADLRYTYTKAGFEQDVILRQQPPTPESLGLNAGTALLQMFTEFSSPQPTVTSRPLPAQSGVVLPDQRLQFGAMQMMQGRAFLLGTNTAPTAPRVFVGKQWVNVQGRQFLIEQVPVNAIVPELAALPLTAMNSGPKKTQHMAFGQLALPPRRLAKYDSITTMTLAKSEPPGPGFVLDYQAINTGLTNCTFRGDTTYFISGTLYFYGTTTIEGGTVVKYDTNGPYLQIEDAVNCQTAPYRPAIFTDKNDDSVGQKISGSTGVPTIDHSENCYFLVFDNISQVNVHNLRFSYSYDPLTMQYGNMNLRDVQFIHNDYPLYFLNANCNLYNVLIQDATQIAFWGTQSTNIVEHMTLDECPQMWINWWQSTIALTNCLLTGVTSLGDPTYVTNDVVSLSTNLNVFQTVGGGSYYLATNSPYRGAGTTNIDPILLADIHTKTTYPPQNVYTNIAITNVVWIPTAQRDVESPGPDLGYHYDPIDYAVSGVTVKGTCVLTNGVAVGVFNTTNNGFYMYGGGDQLIIAGTAQNHASICPYQSVQEQSLHWGGTAPTSITLILILGNNWNYEQNVPIEMLTARFADFNGLNGYGAGGGWGMFGSIVFGDMMGLNMRDCYVGAGTFYCNIFDGDGSITNQCINNLFERTTFGYDEFDGYSPTTFYNNTVCNGYVDLTHYSSYSWIFRDNLFDNDTLGSGVISDHNAYLNTSVISGSGGSDVSLTSLSYATGPLGSRYIGAVSSTLKDVGSRNATNAALYQYTMYTNLVSNLEVEETNSVVDIGYHYVATDRYGNPLDTYVSGVPNYLVDTAGNGMDTNGLPYWWESKYFGQIGLDPSSDPDNDGNTLLLYYQNGFDPNIIQFSLQFTNYNLNTNNANGTVMILGGVPSFVAVLVNDTNQADADWEPYTSTNVAVTLGSTDGVYMVQVGLRGLPSDATQTWLGTQMTLNRTGPVLTITNPTGTTVSMPMVQLQGYASESLSSLSFDVSNAAGVFTNQMGYITDQYYDTNLLAFTTDYFQCYDVALTNGVNTITLHATDPAGNTTTTNFNITLDYSGVTSPPALTLIWPQDGTVIAGNNFTVQAQVDDATATVTATINGSTVQGLMERSGLVWLQNLPLTNGANVVTLTATNAAGIGTTTSITVTQSASGLTVDPISGDQLNQSNVTVTGTISDPTDNVVVNGVQADFPVDAYDWEADNVPVNASGTANLNVELEDSSYNPLGNQNIGQPQPALVSLMSYELTYHDVYNNAEGGNGYDDDYCNWTYKFGGTASGDTARLNQGDDSGSSSSKTPLPAGLGAFAPVAENVSAAGTFNNVSPYYNIFAGPYGTYSTRSRSHLMIVPSGQSAIGTTCLYLLEVSALAYTNPMEAANDGQAGEVPLAPERLQVNGQALINSGITNADGSVMGLALVSGAAGAPVPLTVSSASAANYSFTNVQVFKSKEAWQQDVRNEIYADTGGKADMNTYNPANGFMNNRKNLQAVYAFYQKLFGEDANLLWAGLGKLAGAPVYAGLSDAQQITISLFGIGTDYLTAFQNQLITMNTNILQDLAWQSEAYYKGGINALNVIYAGETNALDLPTINAWREIDDGVQNNNASEIQAGNLQLAHREQLTVLQGNYDILNEMSGISLFMSTLAKNPVLGASAFSTVVPSGNLCVFTDRWNWITNNAGGIWPSWTSASPTDRSSWVNIPLTTRATNYASLPPIIP